MAATPFILNAIQRKKQERQDAAERQKNYQEGIDKLKQTMGPGGGRLDSTLTPELLNRGQGPMDESTPTRGPNPTQGWFAPQEKEEKEEPNVGWRGGLVAGFAGGGFIPGFADGGTPVPGETDTEKYLWKKIKESAPGVAEFLKSHLSGEATGKTIVSALETAGIYGTKAAVGTTLGALSNPFDTGLIDSSPTASADYSAGAQQEEERARAKGAHNLKEMADLGMWAGGIPGFAQGSIRGPGSGTSDSILARLSNGEFVMKDAAVRTYGEGFMHAVNNMQIPPPKYEYGGMVPASSLPRFAEGGSIEHSSTLNLHIGEQVFKGLKAPEAVAHQLRQFAVDQQTTSTGKKPSWVG
jgi:hypothetical protein